MSTLVIQMKCDYGIGSLESPSDLGHPVEFNQDDQRLPPVGSVALNNGNFQLKTNVNIIRPASGASSAPVCIS